MKRKILLFVLILTCIFQNIVYASPEWPSGIGISSESAIVMDSNSKAVLWGQNIHKRYYPASITKILTAMIVLERCNLDDTLTFSHDAIYSVEEGSSSAGYDVGDTLTVKDALYALLLKSANEVANALAEHCAGSIDDFVDIMNEKVLELGLEDTHFANPSGLNDKNHYTSAYDYAILASEAFKNQTLVDIAATQYYELPASKHNKEPFTVYIHHAMLRKNDSKYYEYATCGKTGYTQLAGNTLVTAGKKNGMDIVCVILSSNNTHYTDTTNLMNFAFDNFKDVYVKESEENYATLLGDLSLVTNVSNQDSLVKIYGNPLVTLPKDANLSMTNNDISYELSKDAPKNAFAKITYKYNDRFIGKAYLTKDKIEQMKIVNNKISKNILDKLHKYPILFDNIFIIKIICALLILVVSIIGYNIFEQKKQRKNTRKERINSINISSYKREKYFWEKWKK